MIPCLFMRRSVYWSVILLLLNLYFCDWIICETNNDTVFRPMQPKQLKEFLTDLLTKNSTQWLNCPAPKLPITDQDCRVKRCNNDDDCNNQTCCFNGCVFTCTQQMAPPALIDWYEEPEMNSVFTAETLQNGTSASGHSGDNEMRPCSTSPRPAPSEPVGCPIGYVCRVESSGDPFEGIPSTGICVPDATAGYSSLDDDSLFKEHLGKGTVYLPGGCVLTSKQYDHMQKFMLRSYVVDCFCIKGSVECKVTL